MTRSVVTLRVSVDTPDWWSLPRVLEAVTEGIGWVDRVKQLCGEDAHAVLIEAGVRNDERS